MHFSWKGGNAEASQEIKYFRIFYFSVGTGICNTNAEASQEIEYPKKGK
jgi:hypothetical protein